MVPYCQRKEYELDILQEPLLLLQGEGKERVSENADHSLLTEERV